MRAVAGPEPSRFLPSATRTLGAVLILVTLLGSSGAVLAAAPSAVAPTAPATLVPASSHDGALLPVAHAPLTSAPAPSHGPAMVAPSGWLNAFRQIRVEHGAGAARPVGPDSIGAVTGTDFLVNGTIGKGLITPDNLAYPVAIAFDPTAGTVFVAGGYTSTVGQYDPDNGTVVTFTQLPINWLAVPNIPQVQITAMVFDSQLGEVFVAAPVAQLVYGISATSGAIVSQFSLGLAAYPSALAVDATGQSLFVADAINSSVDKLSASTGAFEGNASVGADPDALAYVGTTSTVYAANYLSDNVSVIGAGTMTTTGWIAVGQGPSSLALNPGTGALWILNQLSGNLSVYTGAPLVTTVTLPANSAGNATGLLYDPSDSTVYALNAPAGHLAAFNASTRATEASLAPGGLPFAAVADPVAQLIEFANISSDELTEINQGTGQIAHIFRLGASPTASVFSAATLQVYVVDPSTYWLTELDARTDAIIGTVALASPGYAVAFASNVGLMAIVETQGAVQFFSTTSGTIVGTWSPGNQTTFANAAYGNGEFFFTGSPSGATLSQAFDEVFAVSASGYVELADVVAGHFDDGLVYDSSTRFVDVETNTSVLEVSSVTEALYATLVNPNAGDALYWTSITWDNVSNELYLGGLPTGNVAVMNLTNASYDTVFTLGGGSPPGVNPSGALYLRQTNMVYFTDAHSGLTYQVSKAGIVLSYTVVTQATGAGASGLSYSTLSGLLYVAGAESGTLTFLTIGPDNTEAMVVTLAISPQTVQLGSPVVMQATATYPEWDDNFSYTGLPGSCPNANVTRMSCTAGAANSFTVTVKAKNPHGISATASAPFVVFSPLSFVAFNATPSQITLGGSFRVQVADFGGVAPITVGYPTRPTGCAATASINWTCTPTAAGNFTLEAEVSDAAGHSVEANLSVIVNPHLAAALKLSTNSTLTGHAVTFTVTVSGGTAPFTYQYTGLPAGCSPTNRSSITCSPTTVGVYPVVVEVSDADGASTSATTQLAVSSSGSTGSNTGGLSTTDLLVIVAIVVIAAIAVIGLAMRRRAPAASMGVARPPPSPPPEEEPPMDEEPPMAEEGSVVEAPPPEPIVPPSPSPSPVVPVTARPANNPSAPAAGAIEEEPTSQYYQGSNVVANPSARGQRPSLICPKCGTANEPWLTNCRKCKRALVTTGG